MKVRTLGTALIALSMGLSTLSFAQPRPPEDPHHEQQAPRRDDGPDRRPARGMEHDRKAVHDERGAGPDHAFHRGGRLPGEWRSRQYVVDDWRNHHLQAPPRGYHWVQTGADYVLVAIASGIIAQVILGH